VLEKLIAFGKLIFLGEIISRKKNPCEIRKLILKRIIINGKKIPDGL